jgi:nitrogen fixation protein NifU and related proteins
VPPIAQRACPLTVLLGCLEIDPLAGREADNMRQTGPAVRDRWSNWRRARPAMVYSHELMRLFHAPEHAGSLPEATHAGTAGTPGCGPFLCLWLKVQDGVVETARWRTFGCPACMACGEAVCRWSEKRRVQELSQVTAAAIMEWVGGVPEEKQHCPRLAAEALRAAIGPVLA